MFWLLAGLYTAYEVGKSSTECEPLRKYRMSLENWTPKSAPVVIKSGANAWTQFLSFSYGDRLFYSSSGDLELKVGKDTFNLPRGRHAYSMPAFPTDGNKFTFSNKTKESIAVIYELFAN